MNSTPLPDDELGLLIEIAYLGLNHGQMRDSESLFSVLRDTNPQNPHPMIGLAMIRYAEKKTQSAIELLRDVLQKFPEAVFTRAVLAQFMKETNEPGWQALAQEVVQMDEQGLAASIAKALLEDRPVGLMKIDDASASRRDAPAQAAAARPAFVGNPSFRRA